MGNNNKDTIDDVEVKSERCGRGWRVALLVLCTIGVCLSADLTRLHVKVNIDPAYHSYCAMSERVNCETVASSEYSVFAGLPLAVWGLLGYLGVAGLAIWGLRSNSRSDTWPMGLLFWASAAFSLLGVVLFLISHYLIGSICLVCTGTYLVNFGMLFVSGMDLKAAGIGPIKALKHDLSSISTSPAAVVAYFGVFLFSGVVLLFLVPPYWNVELHKGHQGLATGVTNEGNHWIGAESPLLEIVEFSDYQCPHCKRGHAEMRKLLERFPDKLRLVHRNYPLDNECNPVLKRPFHPYSCYYARLAYCAGKQDKFWAANDFLFSKGLRREKVGISELASAVGIDPGKLKTCENSEEAVSAVAKDLEAGRSANVRGTPTFVVLGKSYPGKVPDYVLEKALGKDWKTSE